VGPHDGDGRPRRHPEAPPRRWRPGGPSRWRWEGISTSGNQFRPHFDGPGGPHDGGRRGGDGVTTASLWDSLLPPGQNPGAQRPSLLPPKCPKKGLYCFVNGPGDGVTLVSPSDPGGVALVSLWAHRFWSAGKVTPR
jgi:hypothetical protein